VRIAHVTDCYLPRTGGIELQVRDLAAHQRAAGHEVEVLTGTEAAPGVPDEPGVRRLSRRRLRTELREFDAVHAHTSLVSPFAWTGAATGSDLGRPTVVTMHSVPPPGPVLWAAGLAAGWRRWDVQWAAVSEVAARPLRTMLPGREVRVLHNGIDVDAWVLPPRRERVEELTVVSVMRLAQRKRPIPLVKVLARVRAQVPEHVRLRAVLVGDGPRRADVERALARRGMDGWVHLAGRLDREQIRALYRESDLYLAPATLESFGLAALEARSAGLPVVAMRRGGVGEFVRDGVEGYLVDGDAQMAAVTARLLRDRNELEALRAHNTATAPSMTWERVVAASLAAYGAAPARR
jgi:glycosyltransferase involved in cell wall biosynthesis